MTTKLGIKSLIIVSLGWLTNTDTIAQSHVSEQDSSEFSMLDSVVIVGQSFSTPIKGLDSGTITWDLESLKDLPEIFGNSDPLHYTQSFASVQTNTEYDAGLYIQGCDNTHNLLSIDGATIYNASHLLGFFSAFNGSHFSSMQFTSCANSADKGNRLGGFVDMGSDARIWTIGKDSLKGNLSLGMFSSQATLHTPIGKKSGLTASVRASYINLLYKNWLTIDNNDVRYDFGDYNFTWYADLTSKDRIWIDGYWGRDKMKYGGNIGNIKTDGSWGNKMLSEHWLRKNGNSKIESTTYFTSYENEIYIEDLGHECWLNSDIKELTSKFSYKNKHISVGGDASLHLIQPQQVALRGTNTTPKDIEKQKSIEISTYANWGKNFAEKIKTDLGLRGTFYSLNDFEHYFSCDPTTQVTYLSPRDWTLRFSYAYRHQYLFQSGFSSKNLPTEFWISTGQYTKPQSANSFTLTHNTDLFGSRLHLTTETYLKLLKHQVEYMGNIYSFFTSENYDLADMFADGDGKNYGINITLNKQTGKLTTWLSFMAGRSLRNIKDGNGEFPSSHERLFELDAVASYNITKRLCLGTNIVFASGTPFTAPECFYILNSRVMGQMASYNANRLGNYKRIDFSAKYDFSTSKRIKHGINLSVYNAFGFKNAIYHCLQLRSDDFEYRPVYFALRTMPSISYYLKF